MRPVEGRSGSVRRWNRLLRRPILPRAVVNDLEVADSFGERAESGYSTVSSSSSTPSMRRRCCQAKPTEGEAAVP